MTQECKRESDLRNVESINHTQHSNNADEEISLLINTNFEYQGPREKEPSIKSNKSK